MTDDLLFFAKIFKPGFFCRAHAQDIRRQAAQEVKDPGASKIISHRISRSSVSSIASLSGISSSAVMGPPPPPPPTGYF